MLAGKINSIKKTTNNNYGSLVFSAENLFEMTKQIQFFPDKSIEYRSIIGKSLEMYMKKLETLGFSPEIVHESGLIMSIYIDEIALGSEWRGQSEWRHKTLQSEYFNQHMGGEVFFNRLEERMNEHDSEGQVILPLYDFCLQLGFEGKYKFSDKKYFHTLKDRLLDEIRKVTPENGVKDKESSFVLVKRSVNSARQSILFSVFILVVVMFFYLGLYWYKDMEINRFLSEIDKSNEFLESFIYFQGESYED